MMTVENITLRTAAALDKCRIAHLLVGAFSSNYYGIPRSTKDADFVVQINHAIGAEFSREMGEPFELDPQLSFETNTGTYRQIIFHRDSPFKVELFLLSNDAHDQERFKRKRPVEFLGHIFWFPSPEDVVVTKLRWARSKDTDDVRNVMAVQRGKLDWSYIQNWCRQHGTLTLMEKIRRSVPEI